MKLPLFYSVICVMLGAAHFNEQSDGEEYAKCVLGQIYPDSTISLNRYGDSEGSYEGQIGDIGPAEYGFFLRSVLPRTKTHPKWSFFVLTPNPDEIDSTWIRSYLAGKEQLPEQIITPTLIIADRTSTNTVDHIEIGRGAVTVNLSNAKFEPMIGDGAEQLLLTYRAVYYVDAPREVIACTVADLYQIPSLALPFRCILSKEITDVTGKVYVETPRCKLDFRKTVSGDFNDIVVTATHSGSEVVYSYNGERYVHEPVAPSVRDDTKLQERVRAKNALLRGKTLKIRVVNNAGVPIPNAIVSGEVREPTTMMNLEPAFKRFDGMTDGDGEFEIETPGSVLIRIEAEGYFSLMRKWRAGDVPKGTTEIVLDQAPEAVPMFKLTAASGWWKESRDRLDVGVQIKETVGSNYPVVENEQDADLWFEFSRTGTTVRREEDVPTSETVPEYNTSQWRIRIKARNGWSLAPGPDPVQGGTADSLMTVAPQKGYVTELEFEGQWEPARLFYLRHDDGDRYGKITEFIFRDSTLGEVDQGGFSMRGLIQRESTGSSSLHALSPSLALLRRGKQQTVGSLGDTSPPGGRQSSDSREPKPTKTTIPRRVERAAAPRTYVEAPARDPQDLRLEDGDVGGQSSSAKSRSSWNRNLLVVIFASVISLLGLGLLLIIVVKRRH